MGLTKRQVDCVLNEMSHLGCMAYDAIRLLDEDTDLRHGVCLLFLSLGSMTRFHHHLD